MKISYLVNYLDPQMTPFCDTLYELTDHSFKLIQTEAFPNRRIQNHHEDLSHRPYIRDIHSAENRVSAAEEELKGSDVLLSGHSEEQFFDLCVKSGIPTFRLSQLVYRHFDIYHIPLKWKISYYLKDTVRLKNKPVYMLCMGTYTSQDYSLTHSYDGKRFTFGEFPPTEKMDVSDLMAGKSSDPVTILWAGAMEEFRDPKICISLADLLKKSNVKFHLQMVGEGPLLESLKQEIGERKLSSDISLISDNSEATRRKYMKDASIYLETGGLHEGWGQEVNEAMNCGNAVVVSHLVGASAMIRNGDNGFLFEHGNIDNLLQIVKQLIQNEQLRKRTGRSAYQFITEDFTGKKAAERFMKLAEAILKGDKSPFPEGICSYAPVISYLDMAEIAHQNF